MFYINYAILLFIILYLLKSLLKKNIPFASPFLFPLLIFSHVYVIPSIFHKQIFGYTPQGIGAYLHIIGIIIFIAGAFVAKIQYISAVNYPVVVIKNTYKSTPVEFLFILISIGLLLFYGFTTGITQSLLSGASVEEIRRSKEIGMGIIKEPAIIILIYLGLVYFVSDLQSDDKISTKSMSILLLFSVIIFLSTGHKTPSLLLFLLVIMVYPKYHNLNLKTMMMLISILFILIAILASLRSDLGFLDALFYKGLLYQMYIFNANYLPLVELVEKNEISMFLGKEYLNNAQYIMPRILYPDKPLSFDYELKTLLDRSFIGGGLPPTPIGSLYINFGISAVFIGMFLMGVAYSIVYKKFMKARAPEEVAIYPFILFYLLNPSTFIGNIELFLIAITILVFTKKMIRCSIKEC
jgi:oligosaccharide repeat unit polymerase